MQFYSHPTFQLILGISSQNPSSAPTLDNQLKAGLTKLQSKHLTTVKDSGSPSVWGHTGLAGVQAPSTYITQH